MSLALATILLTHDQTALTMACIESLLADGAAAASIWVVDQHSQPPASAPIFAQFPGVNLIALDHNSGFTGGCNLGARAALAAGAQAIFLLNNDTVVERGTLAALQATLEADPDVGAVSPKVYYHGSQRVLQSVGLRVDHNSGVGRMLGSGEVDRGQYDAPADREALFGCALLIRRAAWEQTGALWEPLFIYAEETDWCVRARRLGWRLRYVPGGAVWHRASATMGADSPRKVYLIARNNLYLRQRNHEPGWPGLCGALYSFYVNSRTWARYIRLGQRRQAWALLLGVWDYWRGVTGQGRAADLRLQGK